MNNIYFVAAVWMVLAFVAAVVSIRIGISIALVEILVGAVPGNVWFIARRVYQTSFTTFLASIGSLMLTFLAGAETDPVSLVDTGGRAS
jgi:Kef-type K+ transport system membrane component KefB